MKKKVALIAIGSTIFGFMMAAVLGILVGYSPLGTIPICGFFSSLMTVFIARKVGVI